MKNGGTRSCDSGTLSLSLTLLGGGEDRSHSNMIIHVNDIDRLLKWAWSLARAQIMPEWPATIFKLCSMLTPFTILKT